MGHYFLALSGLVLGMIFGAGHFWPEVYWSLLIFGPVILVGFLDYFQTKQGIRRNFPIIGNLRYFFEFIRPELQQYFVEDNLNGRPISREFRSIVYQRAKGQLQTLPFGTQRDVYEAGHEWVNHSILPVAVNDKIRIQVGGPQCLKPYSASILNISAMSYGALSSAAIKALNLGAKQGGFYHNTGEGGLSPHHLMGGDVVWQIGTGYFGCRNKDGTFNPEAFRERAVLPQVKMIEVKLSQGAKPGKGGVLPAAKVSKEVAEIRLVEIGKDVLSPARHSAFSTPLEMLAFIARLRELSGGKPVGFKLSIGKKHEFIAICRAILQSEIYPDFITVDGAEGGTGAAPLEFANSVGTPLEEALTFVHDTLRGFGLRSKIRIISSGKVFTSFHMVSRCAMGADIINSARGMMLALGCIQALKCNTNHCPAGVATSDPHLMRGLHIPTKSERVAHFQRETVHAFAEVVGAMGYQHPSQVQRRDIFRRMSDGRVKTYEEIFPSVEDGAYLRAGQYPKVSDEILRALHDGRPETFLGAEA